MKSTHKGHCQVCGSLQMLPAGLLSLHGYKVARGFFAGICRGARSLPFEQAHDLVDGAIRRAEQALADLEARQAQLRMRPAKPIAVVNVYVKDSRGRCRHEWRRAEVKVRVGSSEFVHFYHEPFADQAIVRDHDLSAKFDETDPLAVAQKYNTVYAGWLEHEAVSLRRYIAWQSERVRTWTEQPLLAVGAKDKATFKPEEPSYPVVDAACGEAAS